LIQSAAEVNVQQPGVPSRGVGLLRADLRRAVRQGRRLRQLLPTRQGRRGVPLLAGTLRMRRGVLDATRNGPRPLRPPIDARLHRQSG